MNTMFSTAAHICSLLVKSGKLGASLPLPPLRTVRVPFKTHRLKPPIAVPFAVGFSSHTISVSKTYADAPNGGIHNSTFLSSEDSHNLMFLRETNEKSAPFQAYHGFIREADSISSYTVSCFPVPFRDDGICFLSYPLPSATSFDFTAILLFAQMTKGLPSSASYSYDEVRWVLYSGQDAGRVTAAL